MKLHRSSGGRRRPADRLRSSSRRACGLAGPAFQLRGWLPPRTPRRCRAGGRVAAARIAGPIGDLDRQPGAVIVGDLEDADLWIEPAGAAAADDRPRDHEASLPGGDAACEFLAAPIAQHMALELEMEVEAAGAGCCGCRFETQNHLLAARPSVRRTCPAVARRRR